MCGRFALTVTPEEVKEMFALLELEGFPARYNIAPTQPILVVIASDAPDKGSNRPNRKAILVRWGLMPSWVKDPRDFPLLINARSETAMSKASFRAAMRHRRVLVPASGFYEWHRPPKESGEKSQAYWVRPKGGGVIAFAGLMETWSSPDGSEIDTAAVLTVNSNPSFMPIHDRMPVIIQPEDYARWLDCKNHEPREIADLLKPVDDDFLEAVAVSDLVNKVVHTGAEVQKPLATADPPAQAARPGKDGAGGASGPSDGGQLSLL